MGYLIILDPANKLLYEQFAQRLLQKYFAKVLNHIYFSYIQYEIICKAGEQFGMTFDACHFFNGGGDISEIDDIDPSRICVFHLDDMEDVPKEAITDGHRLLPGEGILPLDDICQRLKGIGYDGLCCVELFRAEYWDWDPFELAKKAYTSAEKVLSPHFTLT